MSVLNRAGAYFRARRWPTYLAAGILGLICACISLEVWTIDLRIPMAYWGDSLAVGAHLKTVLETGWISHQPLLGAPYGQWYGDYPQADNLSFLVANLFRPFVHDFGYVMNIWFIVGFPLAAIAGTWFLRVVGVSRTLSVALGVAYSLAPYHFSQGEMHLFLSQYFVVPFAFGLIYQVSIGNPLWALRPSGRGALRVLTWRNAGTLAIIALLGTASSYYSVFFILILAVAGIARVWLTRDWRAFWGAVLAGVLVVVTMVINLLPSLLYQLAHGSNATAFVRSPPEAELNSFKIAALLLPPPGHRFGPFATLRSLYDTHYPLPSEQPALGLIAAAGLVIAIVLMVFLLLSAGRPRWKAPEEFRRNMFVLSGLILVVIILGTVGGASTFLSFVNFPVRTWVRLVIVIGILALAVLGLVLDRTLTKLAARAPQPERRRRLAAVLLALVLTVVALWDQDGVDQAQRTGWAKDFVSDEQFVQKIEATVPRADCLIYQLPYIPFPESPHYYSALDSDQLRPYLHSSTLHWSGGGIKGRPQIEEQGSYASLPVPEMLPKLKDLGACGVVIDTGAYTPGAGLGVADDIQEATGGERFVSENGRLLFVSLQR